VESVRFTTSDGITLEGELRVPEGTPRASAVLCHPHPQYGGSKDHPLLWAIRNDLAQRRFVVLSFNFRGVMGSTGEFGGGIAESQDVVAAIDRVREESAGPTLLVGWSFGANVALRTALRDERVSALALLGFPLVEAATIVTAPIPGRDELRAFERPVLFLAGEADQFCPVPDLKNLARRLPDAEVVVLANTDHFFWRRERGAAQHIGSFAEGKLSS
jgi:alpha/beta superfamily hydrolase